MLFKRFEAEGLSQISYIVGDGNIAAVIDPRRDCDVYVEEASDNGMRITHIFETHRNEDYVAGSVELAALTGAEVFHADAQLDYGYGRPVKDGEIINIGQLKIQAIHTPGHTPGHMSYLLHDTEGNPWVVFTGDALFAGDVGRTDFLGAEKLSEMTGLLYDSIFQRLLPLGDHIIVCPAHGAGSACGEAISDRRWTTLGMERRYNSRLRNTDRNDFIKTGKILDKAPYFRKMEELNAEGAPVLGNLPIAVPLSVAEFAQAIPDSIVLDVREVTEYGASHIPGSVFISNAVVPAYAGWFLTHDKPILLVADSKNSEEVVRKLVRMGYDRIAGILSGGLLSWNMSGRPTGSVRMIDSEYTCSILEGDGDSFFLDVRTPEEVAKGPAISGALNIKLTDLKDHIETLPREKKICVVCGSGMRAMIGASLLKREGLDNVSVILGGMSGLKKTCANKLRK